MFSAFIKQFDYPHWKVTDFVMVYSICCPLFFFIHLMPKQTIEWVMGNYSIDIAVVTLLVFFIGLFLSLRGFCLLQIELSDAEGLHGKATYFLTMVFLISLPILPLLVMIHAFMILLCGLYINLLWKLFVFYSDECELL